MKLKRASSIDYVHQFSDIAFMKFRPKKINLKIQEQKREEQNPFMSRIKSFIGWQSPQPMTSSRVSQTSALSRSSSQVSIKSVSLQSENPGATIIFLQKITPQHFLIGNQNQIDLVFIGGIVGNFIDTESLWQLNIGRPIKNLAIDPKKCHIAIQTNTQIVIYDYDYKKIRQRPQFLTGVKTKAQGKYLRFIRDSVLAVFYKNFIEIYVIEQNKMRKKMCKQIKEAADMELFQVPNAVQNILNVFYIRKSSTHKTFQLWYLQINMKGSQIDMTDLMKVYDIKQGLEKKIKLENFSKEIFLMNLGFQILAVKKGYIIDSAFLNIQQESTFLHYIGNNRLLHLSPQKAQIYRFRINFTTNPPRIDITSLDSIEIKKPFDYQYIGSLEMIDRNFAVFYQIVPHHNKRTKGQITYCFAITRHVTVDQKIREIFTFNNGKQLKDIQLDLIQQRVDMARKIGLNQTQIYLQLWNRTNKTTVEEFKFLLDTLSYQTIKNQIEKKMKKSSMFWRQVYKIQQSCFEMIRQNLFSPRCTQQVVKEFLTSHFLLRKLQLYRDISIAQKKNGKNKKQEEENNDALKINIQNYNYYSKSDIKTFFLQLIQDYCNENKDNLMQIRIFLKSFRFIFRIIYKQLLQDIVSTIKNNLLKLLQNFPQILPYDHHMLKQNEDFTLYEGVWEGISRIQWEKNLHIESLITIDNREVISEIPKSLWFRRNFLTLHDMTGKSREQILRINESNNSDEIFYFFISKIFEHVQDEDSLNKIIEFVQTNYEKMPSHIHNKIFLYRKIYNYFMENNLTKNNQKLQNFHDFLQMKEFELFKQFFQIEKVKKGCLLKDIKEIYETVGGNELIQMDRQQFINYQMEEDAMKKFTTLSLGKSWFNEGILSYFQSDLSQISDLKYILNRINSAKVEFFNDNEQLVYFLVKGCQMKIRIGSDNDVPIDEILLYLENLPFPEQSPVIQQLTNIFRINEEVDRFQQVRINMTIAEILNNCQNVLNAFINQLIKKRKVLQITDMNQMRLVTYDLLAQIQVVKEKIYLFEFSDLALYLYLTKIMEDLRMIPFAAELSKDQFLLQHYSLSEIQLIENVTGYMFKWKLSENPIYIENEQYLKTLIEVLPQDNEHRLLFSNQLQYAKILSAPDNPVAYPIINDEMCISLEEFQDRIKQLPGKFVLTIDIERLHLVINTIEQIFNNEMDRAFLTSINQIYEIIINKLISDNLIIESIPLVKKFLKLPNNQYEAVFPLFYIEIISQELTVQCKKLLLRAVSFLFNQPHQLLNIVEELIGKVFSSSERDQYFKQLALKSQKYRKNYNPKNPILDPIYLELIRNQQMENNFKNMIDQCGHHLVKTKQDFNNFEFSVMFIMLTQQPYALGKYIYCKKYHLNYKVMRSFLSYIIKEEIFSSLRVLQFGRRLFNIIYRASKDLLPFESVASQYLTISMDEHHEFEQLDFQEPIMPTDDEYMKKNKLFYSKLQKCIVAFNKKKLSVLSELHARLPTQTLQKKKQRIEKQLINPVDLSQKAPSEYPFGDSDDDYSQEEKFDDLLLSIRKKKTHAEFNPTLQRNLLLSRSNKNYALFMSTQGAAKQDFLWNSSRGAVSGTQVRGGITSTQARGHRLTKPFPTDGSNNFRYSGGEQQVRRKQKRKSGEVESRTNQQFNLGLSCNVQHFGLTSSAVVNNRKNSNIQNMVYTPQNQHYQQEQSLQLDQDAKRDSFFMKDSFEQEDKDKKLNQQEPQENQSVIQSQQFEGGFNVRVQQIDEDAFMPVNKIKALIMDSVSEQGDQLYVDFSQLNLQQEKNSQEFTNYLISIAKAIYNDSDIVPKTRLRVVKEIQTVYPQVGISKEYFDIYMRFESYHSKYDIPIPINQMFPLDFLFTDQKDPKHLFDQVSQIIVQLVDESNIYKISKIIHLAFKANSFEQEFFFSYLCKAAQKFDSSQMSQNQLNMQLEKLTALIEKLPINIIFDRGVKMVQNMVNNDRREKIVSAMSNCLRKKKSPQQVKKFEDLLKNY